MDAFFAAVEQLDNPEYRGKPLVVGGNQKRGVVAAASYEARKYGVYSAMPSSIAQRKCPDLIFVYPRFDRYKEISNIIRKIFFEYTDLVEPLSLDEAFLDVTMNKVNSDSAKTIAKEIKEKIFSATGLTASAGISINKFLAKIASDLRKPNGLTLIHPSKIEEFMESLPVHKFFGVGKVTAEKMAALEIHTGGDLKKMTLLELGHHFGNMAKFYYNICRGIDHRPVQPDRIRKSISVERTYEEDLQDYSDIKEKLANMSYRVSSSAKKLNIKGRTIQIKIRWGHFETVNRQKTINHYTDDGDLIADITQHLFDTLSLDHYSFRLLGVGLSNLDTEKQTDNQLELDFDD